MIEAIKKDYPNAVAIEWNPDKPDIAKVDGVVINITQAMRDYIPFENIKNNEQSWAIKQLEATDLDILRWFESGVEPIGLKKYRDDLRIYYKNLESGIESVRPILDPRTTLKKIWDTITK